QQADPAAATAAAAAEATAEPNRRKSWLARLREGLSRTRADMTEGLASLFLGKKELDDELLEELETRLLMADVGVEATERIIQGVTDRLALGQLADGQALLGRLGRTVGDVVGPVRDR